MNISKSSYLKGLLILLACSISSTLKAADFIENGIAYDFVESTPDSVIVTFPDEEQTELVKYSGEITIPAIVKYNGKEYNVVAVGVQALKDCTEVTEVILPDGIKSIGASAFSNCRKLKACTLPESLEVLNPQCFYNCLALESINIPEGIEYIPEYAFALCEGLTDIYIPMSVSEIRDYSFFKDSSLTNVTGGENLISIGSHGFANCSKLQEITFYPLLEEIGMAAFSEDYKLVAPDFSTLKKIGDNAFAGCKSFQQIDLQNYQGTLGSGVFNGCTGATSVKLPDIDKIPSMLFANCSNLESLDLPEDLSVIGNQAFYGCASIKYLEIPENVTGIGQYAFAGCIGIIELTGLNHDMILNEGAFQNLNGLKDLTISDIKEVGKDVFAHCRGLLKLKINCNVERIAGRAFSDCTSLSEIYVEGLVPPVITVNSFDETTEQSATLYVQPEAVEIFKQASQWSRFKNIEPTHEFGAGLKEISESNDIVLIQANTIQLRPGTANARIYDIGGIPIAILNSASESIKLPHGLYIISTDTQAIKIAI